MQSTASEVNWTVVFQENDIKHFVVTGDAVELKVSNISCHLQTVERIVNLSTDAPAKICYKSVLRILITCSILLRKQMRFKKFRKT